MVQASRRSESPEAENSSAPQTGERGWRPVRSARTESSVNVVVRFRPRVADDELQDSNAFCTHPNGRLVESMDGSYCFELNWAFSEAATQEEVYDYVGRPIIDDVLSGYNGTIFAYGQTSSGKTYSMFGHETIVSGSDVQSELQGIAPRAARQIFDFIEASVDDDSEFTLRCSFLEVYKEKMRDLLRPTSEKLRVKELPQRGLFVDGLSREYVTCTAEVLGVLRAGYRNRSVARTRSNQHSSRSHAIFNLHVEQRSSEGTERLGKLTLVDLAGSEKVSKSECVGETLEEAKKINWSLSALGKVIDALAERRSHVPYRDSQLTRVLEEALGGNCRTTLLVAASACTQHMDETVSSLRFATRAKNVRNVAKVNFMYSSEQLLLMLGQLQRELIGAKRQIIDLGGLPPEDSTPLVGFSPLPSPAEKARRKRSKSAPRLINPESNLRLSGSGSVPSFCLGRQERQPEEGSSVVIDIDEVSRIAKATSLQSSSSSRLVGTPSRAPSDEMSEPVEEGRNDDELQEALGLNQYDDAYRPMALAARDAVWSLEAALLAQEQALEEARVLSAASAASGERTPTAHGGEGMEQQPGCDVLSERFRALRHAVDARSLHWRLQLEKHRSESMSMELQMRARYSQDLERSLAEANSRLAEALRQDAGSSVKVVSRPSLGSAMRRPSKGHFLPPSGSSPAGGASGHSRVLGGDAATGSAATGSRSRIARPVPRPSAVFIPSKRDVPSSPAASDAAAHAAHLPKDDRGTSASPRGSPRQGQDSRTPRSQAAYVGLTSTPSEAVLWVAGTGDTGGESALCQASGQQISCDTDAAAATEAARAAAAAAQFESRVQELEHQLADSKAQNEALQQSNQAVRAELKSLQAQLQRRGNQLKDVSRELNSRDVRIASLRHEILIKDALLGCLQDEERNRLTSCDEELEILLEKALSPLAAILTREQTATASAAGERAKELIHRLAS